MIRAVKAPIDREAYGVHVRPETRKKLPDGTPVPPNVRTAWDKDTAKKLARSLRAARDEDIEYLVSGSAVIEVDGKPAIVYIAPVEEAQEMEALRRALMKIRYIDDYRTAGLKTNSRVIGYQPRVTLRRDFCTVASSSHEHPAEHAVAVDGARIASGYYERWNPAGYRDHLEKAQRIRPEWRLLSTPFTSGIINDNNPLKYHFDSGNIKGAWSAMFGFKRGIEGGHLACPELRVADGPDAGKVIGFEIADKSLLLFDGQGTLHGVTPIRKTRPDAHRFTVVYYSLAQMWNCLEPGEEVTRIQKLRTEREHRRASGGYDPRALKKGGDE